MKRKIELLAPGGDVDSIKAAILAGADAVYCGLDKFNARNRAVNITFDDLNGILRLAHSNSCEVFLTLNIVIVESEIPALITLLNKLVNTSIDGIIVQDLGMLYLLSRYFKGLKVHASTQLTTHNEGQIHFLSKLAATRVNLCRELNIREIKSLATVGHDLGMLTEVFVHGSNCISFSGICYMSSLQGGNSGNRGRCSQPCRDQYLPTPTGMNFPLNLKDNSAYANLRELADAGVDSIKIEGRIKKFHYVYTVVDAWRKQLQRLYDHSALVSDRSALYKVFNRGFSNAFLMGDISRDMFIDNPRDNSAIYLAESSGCASEESIEKAKGEVYNERTEIIATVEQKLSQLSVAKAPLIITFSGECGTPLRVEVTTPERTFVVLSVTNLNRVGTHLLTRELMASRLKALNDTEYYIEQLVLDNLQPNLSLPFKEITSIKSRLLYMLNGSREAVEPIAVPVLPKHASVPIIPSLSVLVSDQKDLYLCNETSATIYFQLPSGFKQERAALTDLFTQNKGIIPWFPSILIGEDYSAAVAFLREVQPSRLVTNNTGIAYEAYRNGMEWIAGPYLNIANSFSLLCLKEQFGCVGSFISNEISKVQLKAIKRPDDFELYYSISHPIVLMTSRQCLFHQVTGCKKSSMDDTCIEQCERSATITNLKNVSFQVDKSKGSYHSVYSATSYLNTDVVADVPDLFSNFFIDLRDVKTQTTVEVDKLRLIHLFERLLAGNPESKSELQHAIHPTTNIQYKKGI